MDVPLGQILSLFIKEKGKCLNPYCNGCASRTVKKWLWLLQV